jgi:hypothetical protein
MKKKNEGKRRGGVRKHGRTKRKAENRSNPMSLYVRGKITFDKYIKAVKRE